MNIHTHTSRNEHKAMCCDGAIKAKQFLRRNEKIVSRETRRHQIILFLRNSPVSDTATMNKNFWRRFSSYLFGACYYNHNSRIRHNHRTLWNATEIDSNVSHTQAHTCAWHCCRAMPRQAIPYHAELASLFIIVISLLRTHMLEQLTNGKRDWETQHLTQHHSVIIQSRPNKPPKTAVFGNTHPMIRSIWLAWYAGWNRSQFWIVHKINDALWHEYCRQNATLSLNFSNIFPKC